MMYMNQMALTHGKLTAYSTVYPPKIVHPAGEMTEIIQPLAGPPFVTVAGVSHGTAPIDVRERLAVSGER